MQEVIEPAVDLDLAEALKKEKSFNYNKLQAVLCMAASAAVSVGLIIWAASRFL